ncbi:MAG: hypothetical protein M0P39_11175 [Rhodocyclaceae bacterium]|nr:hypothetical protein [Rhodocyclaceae bacterium]
MPAREGLAWLKSGFRLYCANPPLLSFLTLSYLMAVLLANLIPVIGPFLLPLLLPTLTIMVANGCRAIDAGPLKGSLWPPLLDGVKDRRIALLHLGGLNLCASLVVLLLSYLIGDGAMDLSSADESEIAWMLLRLMALASPLLLAFWFAPLLVVWARVPALKAVFFSFFASLQNWRAFLVYGAAVLAFGVLVPGLVIVVAGMILPAFGSALAFLLRMALLLVLAPTLMASVYLSYRDVFVGE